MHARREKRAKTTGPLPAMPMRTVLGRRPSWWAKAASLKCGVHKEYQPQGGKVGLKARGIRACRHPLVEGGDGQG